MAGSNAVASGAAILTTNADQFRAGLKRAEGDLVGWSSRTQRNLAKSGPGAGGGGAGGLLGFLGKGAGPALALTAVGVGVTKLASGFGELTDRIDATSKQARTLGTTPEFLTGLQHAADLSGVSVEQLSKGMGFFRRQVEGPLDAALLSLADRIEQTGDAGERARLLTEAFGKAGIGLAPMFEEGADGIRKMVEENKALGGSFTESQGKAVEAANDAITRAKKSFGGLFQQLIIGLSPVIERFADFANKAFQFLRPVFDWLSRAYDRYSAIAMAVWEAIGDAIKEVAGFLADLGGDLFDWVGELPTIQDVITAVFRAVGTAAALAWDVIKGGAGVVAFAAGVIIESFGNVVTVFKEVVSLAKELPDRLRPQGLDNFIAGVERFDQGVTNTAQKLKDWGLGAMKGFGGSAEQFNKWLDRVLKPKEAAAKVGKGVIEGLEEELKRSPMTFAGALAKGSKEAFSVVLRNQFRNETATDPMKNMVKEQKRGNDLHKAGNRDLGKLREALERIGEV